MPLYDFECGHGHRFERLCSMDDREKPVPCEGVVNRVVLDDQVVAKYSEPNVACPDNYAWVDLGEVAEHGEQLEAQRDRARVLVEKVACQLQARLIIGQHNNPGGAIFHNAAANRDAAREGRYDPTNPSRRFVTKGRGWRK